MAQTAENTGASNESLVVISVAGEGALALCKLDTGTGDLVLLDKQRLPGAAGRCRGVPMAVSADGSRIYVAWRGDAFRLFSFAFDRNSGRLTCLGDASLPADMCYIMVSSCGRHLLSSSNVGSTIAISPIGPDGRAGDPVMAREARNAHCLVEAPNGLVYATSLKGDFIQSYRFNADRTDLEPLARLDLPTGSGPRHIVFTADGARAYLISEFSGTLSCLDVASDTGALAARDRVNLLPEGQKAWAAELRFGLGQDVLYASERNTSQIFGYRLDPQGEMRLIGAEPAPECPCAFALDAAGQYLIALGEKSGEAWTFGIAADGALDRRARLNVGAAPSWLVAPTL